jgi:hypothetical protein
MVLDSVYCMLANTIGLSAHIGLRFLSLFICNHHYAIYQAIHISYMVSS